MSKPSRFIILATIFLFFLIMVAPTLFYQTHFAILPEQGTQAAATTVAIGAVFRSNSRNFLKSTFMSAIRTALRTWIRRLVRLALPILLALLFGAFFCQIDQKISSLSSFSFLSSLPFSFLR